MSKIIGSTVGMGLPKPNLMQTDPTKGDYVHGREEFKQAEIMPDYWQPELDNAVKSINTALCAAGSNKSAFLFYSDAHLSANSWKSPKLLKYLHRHTGMVKVFFGGDAVDAEAPDYETMEYLWRWRAELKDLPNHHSVPGNHDDGNITNKLFSEQYVYGFLLAPEETPDVVRGDGLYYHHDNSPERTRYLHLDTACMGVTDAELNFVRSALLSTPANWHIVVIAHLWYHNDYANGYPPFVNGFEPNAKRLLDMFDEFNARSGDYVDCTARVEFCIGGHYHLDHVEHTKGGIPVIVVEADTLHDRSGTMPKVGTTDEAAISAVIADYNTRMINVIRIGRGEGYTVEIRDASTDFTNQIPISVDTDGSVFNGAGYKTASRLGSSGTVSDIANSSASSPVFVTGFIPVKHGDVVRLKNCYIDTDDLGDADTEAAFYGNAVSAIRCGVYHKENYEMASVVAWPDFTSWGVIASATPDINGHITEFAIGGSVSGFMRLTLAGNPEAAILTVNEHIYTYTNVIPASVGSDGKIFNSGKGWADKSRIGSGVLDSYIGNGEYFVTGHIEIDPSIDNTIRMKNVAFDRDTTITHVGIAFYDASFARIAPLSTSSNNFTLPSAIGTVSNGYDPVLDGTNIVQFTLKNGVHIDNQAVRYIAFCAEYIGDDSIITVNEPIE